ncbi:glycoside hydrolase family 5 protein [Variovorax sp. GB1R11]|uniref:glycoside hydrolase family 5 protein n=1 Tax=Variovorax sp. GB1R11 TaxID=3443741 RepID=UPI003F48FC23
MQKLKLIFSFVAFFVVLQVCNAAPLANTNPLKGFNIDDRLTEQDFRDLKELNVKLLRVSFPREPFLEGSPPFKVREQPFIILDKYLRWAKLYQFQIVLDPHYFPGMKGKYSTTPEDLIWSDRVAQDAIVNLWEVLARRYAGQSSQFYGYDLFNEPAMPEEVLGKGRCEFYNKFIRSLIAGIRKYDQRVPLIVQFPFALNAVGRPTNQMDDVDCVSPVLDAHIIYSFHMYDPGRFTHQGVLNGFDKGVRLVGDGNERKLHSYLSERMKSVLDFQRKYSVNIYVGEFGVSNFAGNDGDRYVKSLLEIFGDYGWDWTYHSFREAVVWDPELAGATTQNRRDSNSARMRLLKNGISP